MKHLDDEVLLKISRTIVNITLEDLTALGMSVNVRTMWARNQLLAINLMDDASLGKLTNLINMRMK